MVLDNKDLEDQLALIIKLKSVPNIQSLVLVAETFLSPVERIWNRYGTWIFFCGTLIFSSLITMYCAIVLGFFLYKLNNYLTKDEAARGNNNQN